MLVPDFRGRNEHREACESVRAQADVLDAVKWVRQHDAIDSKRIYLMGWWTPNEVMARIMAGADAHTEQGTAA